VVLLFVKPTAAPGRRVAMDLWGPDLDPEVDLVAIPATPMASPIEQQSVGADPGHHLEQQGAGPGGCLE
jgi:hypothetical protein